MKKNNRIASTRSFVAAIVALAFAFVYSTTAGAVGPVGTTTFNFNDSGSHTFNLGSFNSGDLVNFGTTSGTVLDYTGGFGTLNNSFTVVGGTGIIQNTGGGLLTLSGTLTKNGTTLIFQSGGFNVTGNIVGALANSDIIVNAGGSLTISNPASYNGNTWVSGGGTLNNGINNALPTNTILNMGSTDNTAGSYNLMGYNQTIAGLNSLGSATSTISNGGAVLSTLTVGDSGSYTFGGVIKDGSGGGALALTMAGTGTLTLTKNNTYTGGTTINAGVLQIGNGGATGSVGSGVITNNAAIVVNHSNTITSPNLTVGTGSLTQAGSGTLILNLNNTYSGGTWINAGSTLQVGNGGANGAPGTGAIVDNGTLVINHNNPTLSIDTYISGTGNLVQAGSGTIILTSNNTYTGATTINAGVMQVGDGGTSGSLGTSNVVDNASLVFNRSDDITVANNISGTGSLTQATAGILTLTGSNSFTGTTLVTSNGTLRAGTTQATGLAPGNLVLNNGVFQLNGGGTYTNGLGSGFNQIQVLAGSSGFSTFGGDGTINLGNAGASITWGSANFNPDILVLSTPTASGTLTFVNALNFGNAGRTIGVYGDYTNAPAVLQGNIIGGISSSLTVDGTGRLILTGNNGSFSGSIQINAGTTLQVGGTGTGQLGSGFGDILDFGTLLFNLGGGTTNTVNNLIKGSGNVIQQGAGPVVFNNYNTYTGGTIITNNSTVLVSYDHALGTGSITMFNGTTLGYLGSFTLANDILLTGDPTFYVTNNALAYESGNISGAGDLVKTGAGTLILTGSNSYSGPTTISNGVLMVGNSLITGSLGTGAITNWATLAINSVATDSLILSNSVSGTGTLSALGGLTILTGSNDYSGTTTIAGGAQLQVGNGGTLGTLGDGTGAVNDNGALIFNRSDSNVINNVINGSGNVVQSGTGVTVLTGANGYLGSTLITNGTLAVGNDTALGGSLVTVNGGTIGAQGNHTVANNINLTGLGIFDTTGGNLTFNGFISGTGALISQGPGTNTLNGPNNYSGGTSNNSGWLVVGNNSALGGGNLAMNGGTLSSGGGTVTIVLGNTISLLASTNNIDTTGGNLTVGRAITGAGTTNDVWKYGANTLTVTSTNVYQDTYVQAGTFVVTGTGITSNRNAFIGWQTNNAAAVVTGTQSAWIMSGAVDVGFTGDNNSLTITNGGLVSDSGAYVGEAGGNNNSVLVAGSGSKWINNGDLFVGDDPSSNNSLVISNGAVVTATNTWVGMDAGSTNNSITVTDAGSRLVDYGNLIVGETGAFNRVSILNGGVVSNVFGIVGDQAAASNNTALVDGTGSIWNNSSDLTIGNFGVSNSLTIQNGGVVSNANGYVGLYSSATYNSVTVNTGTWINTGVLFVGPNGNNNSVTVTNGGFVSSVGGAIGFNPGSSNNSVLVTGSGSVWTNAGILVIGDDNGAAFNQLTILNSGKVYNANAYIGSYDPNASNNSALVSGAGSAWINSGDLTVGDTGSGNSLTISNGGFVSDVNGVVGNRTTASNNTALVDGSIWNNTGNLTVGATGSFNSVTVQNSGVVSNANGYVGFVNANNNSVLVTGAGSQWINSGDLVVGYDPSSNNSLVISNSALVTATNTVVGYTAGSTNNSITVTDAGSRLVDYGNLTVGETGAYNHVQILNQGVVSNVIGIVGNAVGADTNSVLVDNGRWINSSNLTVGVNGQFNSLTITNGGYVENINGVVGDQASASNNTALVDGSIWNNTGNLTIGNLGVSNSLTVQNSGVVSNVIGIVGNQAGADYNSVVLNKGNWINSSNLTVGVSGQSNSLVATNGSYVSDVNGIIGDQAGASNNIALVKGSTWVNTGDLTVGNYGSSNSLLIHNSGLVSNVNGVIGNQVGANYNTADVKNGAWVNTGNLTVGKYGVSNSLTIQNNGIVSNVIGLVGNQVGADYNSVVVSNGSAWVNSGNLTVGVASQFNSLVVTNGSLVSDVNGVVGDQATASNNTVVVDGSIWNNTGNLTIGNAGVSNSLTVQNGGVVSNVIGIVGNSGNSNSVLVTGLGSQWINSSNLTVGVSGQNNALTIKNNGFVQDVNGVVGDTATASNNSALVQNSSIWNNTGNLTIGNAGVSNSLTVQSGSVVSNVIGVVGNQAGANYNTVLVNASKWINSSNLTVGVNGQFNSVTDTSGGLISDVNGVVGDQAGANSNRVTVTNGSRWVNSGDLTIGNAGATNSLTVQNGSVVSNVIGIVGNQAGANYNTVLVHNGGRWINSSNLTVGVSGQFNTLTVDNGGTVADVNGIVGDQAGANSNAVSVANGGHWNNSGNLTIGNAGATNSLTIRTGGVVSNVVGIVGSNANYNTVFVNGGTSKWINTSDLTVGVLGSFNSLTATNGSLVQDVNGVVGDQAGANNNTALVDGSRWVNSGNLTIGNAGISNSLTVQNSGIVSNVTGIVGNSGNYNVVLVTDPGSQWNNSDQLTVGYSSSFNSLVVSNGGIVNNASYGNVGGNYFAGTGVGANSNTVVVTDSGSQWNNNGSYLFIGNNGAQYNSVTVTNGGLLNAAGDSYLGINANNNNVLVTGTGSVWNTAGDLYIGYVGNTNMLTINQGGVVSNQNAYVGDFGNANSVLVTDTGSAWINNQNLTIGYIGENNSLTISNSGTVSSVNGYVGDSGNNNSVLVTDAGSVWTNSGNLTIGYIGAFNSLTIQKSGVVYDVNGYVGNNNGNNNTALVTGAGSKWINSGDLFVGGDPSSNNSLMITNGAFVSATNSWVGLAAGSTNNSVTVTDPGSLWVNTGNLTVGETGAYNYVQILNQGVVSNVVGIIGDQVGANNNSVLVSGTNSVWNNSAELNVGYLGAFNSLVISNGGVVNNAGNGANVGGNWPASVGAGANSNTVLVTGPGSAWNDNGSYLFVGAYGAQYNSVTVTNGGLLTSSTTYLGYFADNNSVLVTGTNSLWNNTGELYIGGFPGDTNTLTISQGGVVSNTYAYIGDEGNKNSVLITDPGSAWVNNGDVQVGTGGGQFNSLMVSNGGTVSSYAGYIGYNQGNSNNFVTVTGSGSAWNMSGDLIVGRSDSGNSLSILNSGVVNDVNGTIGYYGGGGGATVTNNSVLVSGAGSQWNNSGNLTVGRKGQYSTLTITNGGLVSALNVLEGANASSVSNKITITGSSLIVTNAAGGLVDIRSGALVFNSGTIALNTLMIETNGTYSDTSAGVLNLVNANPTINIATGLSVTVNSTITGTNGLNSTGQGTLTLTASNLYSGVTSITGGGTLSISSDSNLGVVPGAATPGSLVINGGTLLVTSNMTLNSNRGIAVGPIAGSGTGNIAVSGGQTLTYNGIIANNGAGVGGLVLAGPGTTVLGGSNTYSGGTWINGGTLTVQNSQAVGLGNLNLISGALVNGTGAGAAAPVMLKVSGSYTQAVGGTLVLGIGGTSAGSFGWLNVTNNASINGTLQVILPAGSLYQPLPFDTNALIVASNGRTGTFATFNSQIPQSPLVQTNLDYNPNNVTLRWSQLPFSAYNALLTPNGRAVAGALDSAITDPRMKGLFSYLDYLPAGTNGLRNALALISPDNLSSLGQVGFSGLDSLGYGFLARIQDLLSGSHGFNANRLTLYDTSGPSQSAQPVNQMFAQAWAVGDGPLSQAKDNPWGLYLQGNGEFANVRSDANASAYHLTSGGVTLGLDRRVSDELVIGVTVGYQNTSASLINDGHVDVDNGRGSIYAAWFNQGYHLEGMLAGGYNHYETSRPYVGNDWARGKTDGTEFSGLFGGGYDWKNEKWTFGPQLTLQYKRVDIDGFTETTTKLTPLTIMDQTQESFQSRIGGHIGYRATMGKVIVAPDLNVSWQHEYLDKSMAIDARFANGAGNPFTVQGPVIGADSRSDWGGPWIQWNERFGTYLNYTTQLGTDNYNLQSVNGGINIRF